MRFSTNLLICVAGVGGVLASPAFQDALLLTKRAGCTADSLAVKSMTLKTWNIWHAMSASAHLLSTFTIFNPAVNTEYKIKNMPFVEDGDWHKCDVPADIVPKQLAACQYQLDTSNGGVNFQLQWICKDGDSGRP
jgi:hypothetical protein